MDTPYGRPAKSVRRFSLMKWGVCGVLLALLLFAWSAGDDTAGDAPSSGDGRAGSAAGVAPAPASLSFEFAPDGSVRVKGVVADETTRNQWLNEIRIGAQGSRVIDELRID